MSFENLFYIALQLIDLKTIMWAIVWMMVFYFILRFAWRLAMIVLRDVHRVVIVKIDALAIAAGAKILAALSPSPEQKALRAAWKKDFRSSMTWAQFLKLNEKVGRR